MPPPPIETRETKKDAVESVFWLRQIGEAQGADSRAQYGEAGGEPDCNHRPHEESGENQRRERRADRLPKKARHRLHTARAAAAAARGGGLDGPVVRRLIKTEARTGYRHAPDDIGHAGTVRQDREC